MTRLVWDAPGSRTFETGVDRCVLYPPNADGVAWNGVTDVSESHSDGNVTPYYLDGVKIYEVATPSDFSATLAALTYPDEFLPFDGIVTDGNGFYFDGQVPQTFGLSYRTLLGNDQLGQKLGYKIHLLYNLTAVPTDRDHATISDSVAPSEFSWALTGVPVSLPSARATPHITVDSRDLSTSDLQKLEAVLYGSPTQAPSLPQYIDMFSLVTS